MVEAQQHAGSASSLDLDRSQVALERARASLAPLVSQRQSALFELAALLGKPPAGVPEVAAKCERAPLPQAPIAIGDGASLLKRRPDVAESERRLAAATARIGVASADLRIHSEQQLSSDRVQLFRTLGGGWGRDTP